MEELSFLRIFNLLAGVIGLAVAIGVLLIPSAVSKLEKKLDKDFSTDALDKMLNQRRNLSEALLKHPRAFGLILLFISFFLTLSSILLF
ncbi:MAG: hypothetical protein AUJ74_03525 [Candidatus Omnitrophica bacterium CG1_02_44_16]|nr:MAG: hypothetical protein AUJ74_03525 [Candidatus Omnitrophica bacterium CG1_02_44_16]PIY83364.1 MAG: hypothetical protein COY78_02280 [Candidatus Omnitrophica bacterium CG_4_10_14_0_8_um_filter_44_12]PIZ84350.1 MAG: hypothetical protein COX96_04375 [Candidatus Omnitrophica bacterium CG_4_10_14_0_2_um_filter_44_9]